MHRVKGRRTLVYIGGQLTNSHAKIERGEVKWMWKWKLYKLLLTLAFAAVMICLLTTKAC